MTLAGQRSDHEGLKAQEGTTGMSGVKVEPCGGIVGSLTKLKLVQDSNLKISVMCLTLPAHH